MHVTYGLHTSSSSRGHIGLEFFFFSSNKRCLIRLDYHNVYTIAVHHNQRHESAIFLFMSCVEIECLLSFTVFV